MDTTSDETKHVPPVRADRYDSTCVSLSGCATAMDGQISDADPRAMHLEFTKRRIFPASVNTIRDDVFVGLQLDTGQQPTSVMPVDRVGNSITAFPQDLWLRTVVASHPFSSGRSERKEFLGTHQVRTATEDKMRVFENEHILHHSQHELETRSNKDYEPMVATLRALCARLEEQPGLDAAISSASPDGQVDLAKLFLGNVQISPELPGLTHRGDSSRFVVKGPTLTALMLVRHAMDLVGVPGVAVVHLNHMDSKMFETPQELAYQLGQLVFGPCSQSSFASKQLSSSLCFPPTFSGHESESLGLPPGQHGTALTDALAQIPPPAFDVDGRGKISRISEEKGSKPHSAHRTHTSSRNDIWFSTMGKLETGAGTHTPLDPTPPFGGESAVEELERALHQVHIAREKPTADRDLRIQSVLEGAGLAPAPGVRDERMPLLEQAAARVVDALDSEAERSDLLNNAATRERSLGALSLQAADSVPSARIPSHARFPTPNAGGGWHGLPSMITTSSITFPRKHGTLAPPVLLGPPKSEIPIVLAAPGARVSADFTVAAVSARINPAIKVGRMALHLLHSVEFKGEKVTRREALQCIAACKTRRVFQLVGREGDPDDLISWKSKPTLGPDSPYWQDDRPLRKRTHDFDARRDELDAHAKRVAARAVFGDSDDDDDDDNFSSAADIEDCLLVVESSRCNGCGECTAAVKPHKNISVVEVESYCEWLSNQTLLGHCVAMAQNVLEDQDASLLDIRSPDSLDNLRNRASARRGDVRAYQHVRYFDDEPAVEIHKRPPRHNVNAEARRAIDGKWIRL